MDANRVCGSSRFALYVYSIPIRRSIVKTKATFFWMTEAAYNIGVLISSAYLLEKSADVFISKTAIVSKRLRTPEVLIALLTAGAEWEEVSTEV